MASPDETDKKLNDKSDIVIDLVEGGEETAKRLAESGAPTLQELRDQTTGRKVVMSTDELDYKEAPMPHIPSGPELPKGPVPQTFEDMYRRQRSDWGDAIDGKLPSATTLLETAGTPEAALAVVDGDLNPQAVSKELVAAVQAVPSRGVVAEAELPELAPALRVVPPAEAETDSVFTDSKTPPNGTRKPDDHTGLSIPDGEPVTEPEASLPPPPGRRMTDELLADMNAKDEADPKTSEIDLKGYRPPGELFKSDRLLDQSRTEKPFDKEAEKWERLKERTIRAIDLKKHRVLVRKERWKHREVKKRLEELREKEVGSRKAIEEQEDGLKKLILAAKVAMQKHKAESDAAQAMAQQMKEKIEGDFEKLHRLTKLTATLIESDRKVAEAKQPDQVDVAAKLGNEAEASIIPLLKSLDGLPNNRSQYHESRRLELEELAKYHAIFLQHKPLLEQLKGLKAEAEPFNAKIRDIDREIAEVDQSIAYVTAQIEEIDAELKELAPADEDDEET